MYNYVQRVFVGKASGATTTGQTAGQQINLANIVVGDLILVDENGVVLDAAAASTAKLARVMRGVAPGKVISSSLLKSGTGHSTKYTYEGFQAAVAQVSTFADLGLQPNTDYKLQVVIQQDLKLVANRQDRIEVYHTTGTTVGVADYQAIVRKFNSQRKGLQAIIVASTSGGTNFTLTGQPVLGAQVDDYSFVRFEPSFVTFTAVNGVTGRKEQLSSPTSIKPSSETKAQGGRGVAVQVRAMERVSLSNFGFTDLSGTPYKPAIPYAAVDGVGYDIYNVQQLLSGEYQFQDDKKYPHSTVIAVATGSAQKTAFGGILDAFMQGVAPATATGE